MPARHALEAVLAAGDGNLQDEEEHHLRQGQGDHGEIDARAADRQHAEHPAERGGGHGAGEDAQFGAHPDIPQHVAAYVAGQAEKGGMAEGQQAGEAQQQIECGGEQAEAQNLHQKDGVHQGRCKQAQQKKHDDDCTRLGVADSVAVDHDVLLDAQDLPNKPAGRTSSTMTMTTNTTMLDPSG